MDKKTSFSVALNGFLAVALGAFAAHALKPTLLERGTLEIWQTATHYQLAHALAGLSLIGWAFGRPASAARLQLVARLWLLGCLLFAGSLYAIALGAPHQFGYMTPLGGLAFLVGWGLLAWESVHPRPN